MYERMTLSNTAMSWGLIPLCVNKCLWRRGLHQSQQIAENLLKPIRPYRPARHCTIGGHAPSTNCTAILPGSGTPSINIHQLIPISRSGAAFGLADDFHCRIARVLSE